MTYCNAQAWPLLRTNRSRLIQLGLAGLALMKRPGENSSKVSFEADMVLRSFWAHSRGRGRPGPFP